MAPLYFIKKEVEGGDPKIIGSFTENDDLYVLSSEPTAKYSKLDVLRSGELQEDKKFDPKTSALAIKSAKNNIFYSVGSANDIDDIFIENSDTQIKAQDFPLYKALKTMNKNGYSIDMIVDEIRKHSNNKDQQKRLVQIFLEQSIERTSDGGENLRRVQRGNEDMNGIVGFVAGLFPEIGREEIINLLEFVNEGPGGDEN